MLWRREPSRITLWDGLRVLSGELIADVLWSSEITSHPTSQSSWPMPIALLLEISDAGPFAGLEFDYAQGKNHQLDPAGGSRPD